MKDTQMVRESSDPLSGNQLKELIENHQNEAVDITPGQLIEILKQQCLTGPTVGLLTVEMLEQGLNANFGYKPIMASSRGSFGAQNLRVDMGSSTLVWNINGEDQTVHLGQNIKALLSKSKGPGIIFAGPIGPRQGQSPLVMRKWYHVHPASRE